MTEKKTTTKTLKKTVTKSETTKLKGRYVEAVGRRKTSSATVRLYKNGTGNVSVNNLKDTEYFSVEEAAAAKQPLKLSSHLKDLDVSINVSGGGKRGQADAIRHGLTRALVELDEDLKLTMKAKGWLTRDARKKERKKPGLRKARRAPQWSKR